METDISVFLNSQGSVTPILRGPILRWEEERVSEEESEESSCFHATSGNRTLEFQHNCSGAQKGSRRIRNSNNFLSDSPLPTLSALQGARRDLVLKHVDAHMPAQRSALDAPPRRPRVRPAALFTAFMCTDDQCERGFLVHATHTPQPSDLPLQSPVKGAPPAQLSQPSHAARRFIMVR